MGNEEFANGNFQAAVDLYSKAISIKEHEIYFSNRKASFMI